METILFILMTIAIISVTLLLVIDFISIFISSKKGIPKSKCPPTPPTKIIEGYQPTEPLTTEPPKGNVNPSSRKLFSIYQSGNLIFKVVGYHSKVGALKIYKDAECTELIATLDDSCSVLLEDADIIS